MNGSPRRRCTGANQELVRRDAGRRTFPEPRLLVERDTGLQRVSHPQRDVALHREDIRGIAVDCSDHNC